MPCSLLSLSSSSLSARVQKASKDAQSPVECTCCGVQVHSIYTDLDHRLPKFLGGQNKDNLQRLCLNCHRGKSLYENIVLQPIKNKIKEILQEMKEDGVVTLKESPAECAGRAIGSCIKDFKIHLAKELMEERFTNRKRPRTPTIGLSKPSTPAAAATPMTTTTPTTPANKWTAQDERLLVTICFGRQVHLTRYTPMLDNWHYIQNRFNKKAQRRRSIPALKRRLQRLRSHPN